MQLPAAAVVYSGDSEGDAVLERILIKYQRRGLRIRGLVTHQGKDPSGKLPMQLRDFYTGKIFTISQYLGRDARGCNLDVAALIDAGQVLRRALEEQPDLVFINRFGFGETQGRGLSQELTQLISAGIPVLTLVAEKYLEGWQDFSDGMAATLPLDSAEIEQWLDAVQVEHGAKA